MRLNGNLILNSDASGEIQQVYLERRPSAPAISIAEKGRIYFNTASSKIFYSDGTAWQEVGIGTISAAMQVEIDAIEASLGPAVSSAGVFNGGMFPTIPGVLVSPTSFTNAISQVALAVSTTSSNTLNALSDVSIGALQNKDVFYYNASAVAWTNGPAGPVSGVQPYDLALSNLADGGTGMVVMSGDSVFFRTLTAPAEGIIINNGSGVDGNPGLELANDLLALENLAANGIAARTAADTWVTRTLVTSSQDRIVLTNGDGVGGNPAFDLAPVADSGSGTFLKFTRDAYGRVTGTTPVVLADITAFVDSRYVNVTGDSLTGNLTFNEIATVTGLPLPVNGTDAANKNYVDARISGLSWVSPVRAATTASITLSGEQTIDTISVVGGDRVLVKNQSTTSQNGIYVVSAGAWTRATDNDEPAEFESIAVLVTTGAVNAETRWTQIEDVTVVGTSSVTFVQFSGSDSYVAGDGLSITGNTFAVKFGAGLKSLPSTHAGISLYSYASSALAFADGTGARRASEGVVAAADTLHLFLEGSSLSQSSLGLKVSPGGISGTELSTSVAGAGLAGGGGSPLSVNVDGTTLEITSDSLNVKDSGITNVKIANGTIQNAKLVNNSITFTGDSGTDAVALGETLSVSGANGISVTVGANAITVTNNASVSDASDVNVTTPANGHTLVYTTSPSGEFVNRPTYYLYSSALAAATHVVTHGLGQKYCNVTVVSDADEVIIPEAIVFNSTSQLTVSFSEAINCKVVVMGVNLS
jgi:hypothetical protein